MSAFPTRSISVDAEFARFTDLPSELRREIWLYCLPDRIEEFDVAHGKGFFYDDRYPDRPPPCTLTDTSYLNSRPPLITQICYEARDVAFKEGKFEDYKYITAPDAPYASPDATSFTGKVWRSHSPPKLIHLNWHDAYNLFDDCYANYSGPTDALRCLEHVVSVRNRCGSMMKNYLTQWGIFDASRIQVFNRHPQWLVVMHLVVIHAPKRVSAASGLFGLLGDAPIQIVETTECHKMEAMYGFAEQWRQPDQTGIRRSRNELEDRLERELVPSWNPDIASEYATSIRAAVMFRACHLNCSSSDAPPV